MPRLSVWFLRAALLYLAAGFTLGALMLANKGLPFAPQVLAFFPAHIEFLLVGWTVQLALGVGYWILPRLAAGGRGSPGETRMVWLAWAAINLGILLVVAGPLLGLAGPLTLAGRLLEAAAVVAFALANWRRARPTYR